MKNITITPATIEAACLKLKEQLQGAHVCKDKLDISIPTKWKLDEVDKPTVMVSIIADRKMRALVQQCDKEIGWHGTVSYDAESNTYLIEDIFVFPQEVTGTTVQSIDEVYGLWLMETFDDEQFAKLRMHGHSHVNMGITPSGIDTAYQEVLTDRVNDFYIFIILNKRDDYYVCLFDIANNYMYDKEDIFYDAEIEETDAWAKDVIATQVKTKTYATAVTTTVTTPVTSIEHPVVLTTWQEGWVWNHEAKGFVPKTATVLKKYLKEQGAQSDRRKPGRPKGAATSGITTKPGAYEEHQQQVVRDIDHRKHADYTSMYSECEGNCIRCQLPNCPYGTYNQEVSYVRQK